MKARMHAWLILAGDRTPFSVPEVMGVRIIGIPLGACRKCCKA